ncbi:MAG: RsfS/YbeB/iojap family protein [Flavonifractor sp.]|nr:RsfS/YbeB/iojap family protein [Flavonifractor sp.]
MFALVPFTRNTPPPSWLDLLALNRVRPPFTPNSLEVPHHIEGHRGGTWVLLDFSAVVVHIFNDEARKFYDLERLWSDAQPVDLGGVLTAD